MTATLCLAEGGGLLLGTTSTGQTTITIAKGAQAVAQAAAVAVSLRKGQAWYAPDRGIDFQGLFVDDCHSDESMIALRRTAFLNALQGVCGVEIDGGEDVTFEREGTTIRPILPCIKISCDELLYETKVKAF